MLVNLSIQNFALIKQWNIEFFSGETVLTGETGSGKSLFVDALLFLLGKKPDRRAHRTDGDMAVEGAFLVEEKAAAELLSIGVEAEEGWVILRRQWNGSITQSRINNKIVTQSVLREVGKLLMDVHSQNAQSLLADTLSYRRRLDRAVGEKAERHFKNLRKLLSQKKEIEEKLTHLKLTPEE